MYSQSPMTKGGSLVLTVSSVSSVSFPKSASSSVFSGSFGNASALSPTPSPSLSFDSSGSFGNASSESGTPSPSVSPPSPVSPVSPPSPASPPSPVSPFGGGISGSSMSPTSISPKPSISTPITSIGKPSSSVIILMFGITIGFPSSS